MAAAVKNTYEEKHDKVIMEALEQSPNNRNEAFRIASKMLKDKFGMVANANQISSRFYTNIKPKYVDEPKTEPKNQITTSAGAFSSNKKYSIVKDLALRLEPSLREDLIRELVDSLS